MSGAMEFNDSAPTTATSGSGDFLGGSVGGNNSFNMALPPPPPAMFGKSGNQNFLYASVFVGVLALAFLKKKKG